MTIAEVQLETWLHQGSIQQSAATYAIIKKALQQAETPFAGNVDIFLQGSYGNDTNIYADSDVDIVVQYTAAFYKDTSLLPPDQKTAYESAFTDHNYAFAAFRTDVLACLRGAFGASVSPSNKAIKIAPGNGRRSADVVPSFGFRHYLQFPDIQHESFAPGITFWTQNNGAQIVNYPKLHSERLTSKHQATRNALKPAIRIFKNIRNSLIDKGAIKTGIAPSYFIEGMLYNVPNDLFSGSRQNTMVSTLRWLTNENRDAWQTPSGQHYLVRDGHDVCWPAENCTSFLNAVASKWNG